MNALDIMIGWLSPEAQLRRVRARMAISAYEAARPSRTHQAKRSRQSGQVSTEAAAVSLREQARALDEDHDIVIGLLDKLEERVIGAHGIQIEPQPRDLSGAILPELAADIRRRWATWSLRPEVTHTLTRPQMERRVMRSWLRDGEVFGKRVRGTVPGMSYPTGCQFAIELLEADYLPITLTDTAARIRAGIELNGWGQRKAYHFYYDHPGNLEGFRVRTRAIPADDVYALQLIRRLHQLRGVSLLHGVITRLSDLKSVEEAERVAARISASMAFFIKKNASEYQSNGDSPGEPRSIDIAPGMTFDDLQPGEEVGVIQSNRPNTQLNIWREGQLRSVAAGTRLSYSSVARDYAGSYSSQRQELVESGGGYEVLQDEFVAQWARPVYRDWLTMELLRTDDPLALPPGLDLRTLHDATYLAPVLPWIDPVKEAEGWKKRIRAGTASETQWIRANGDNPDEVRRQLLAEREWAANNGVMTDTNPAHDNGANHSEQTQPPAQPADPDDPAGQRGDDPAD